ncbi:ParB/RepB/Spo0J family partition protein [Serratia ficaria]|uniref:ParB/RepB/Spo0J family partition protein n=1 Tax=Serratia ficaria TaxID=61651 RepID=UPI00217C790E|nr:chromosome partitioning protein ParB [Serratia ficaria]CAI1141028.1 ParB/RepB/Spo0J family partition protein [Serratia ficaria]CAI2515360.1 ParB/RepB/Spo0J family partition protein [Serratia ficaria]
MANSFKQMKNNGTLKRTDSGMFIKLDDIHVQEGFNKRVDDERTQVADDDLFNHLAAGKPVPPLEVRPRDDGGVWLVEGHRRHRAYTRCREAGKPVEWIAILPFTGSDVERIARIMNSNSQLALTPYEQSQVVKELSGFNLTPDEIAALVGKSRATVDKLLALTQANHDVQTLVKDGAVAVDAAVDRVKQHGDAAGRVLAGDVEKAKKAGRSKVTKSFIAPQFSAPKSRNLVKIFAQAEVREIDGQTAYILPAGTQLDVLAILDEYRSTSTKENGDDQAL